MDMQTHLEECAFAQVTCDCGKTLPRTEVRGRGGISGWEGERREMGKWEGGGG